MNIETGKTYKLTHSRKGTFVFFCESQDTDFAHGHVVSGRAKAMLPENERERGEELSIRKDFITSAAEQA